MTEFNPGDRVADRRTGKAGTIISTAPAGVWVNWDAKIASEFRTPKHLILIVQDLDVAAKAICDAYMRCPKNVTRGPLTRPDPHVENVRRTRRAV